MWFQDWQDDRLRWDKEEFNNLEDVVVRPERVWLPELALMNGFVYFYTVKVLNV
jgi:Neurotransmitter-gated ion-channel ligand binding domain